MLLGSDENRCRVSEEELAERYHLSVRSVERIRKRFFEEGMAIFEKKVRKTRSDKKIDGRVEAHLVALVCQGPPEGESRWKLQLLADRLVALQVVEHISSTMVSRLLKKRTWTSTLLIFGSAFPAAELDNSSPAERLICLQDGTGAGRV